MHKDIFYCWEISDEHRKNFLLINENGIFGYIIIIWNLFYKLQILLHRTLQLTFSFPQSPWFRTKFLHFGSFGQRILEMRIFALKMEQTHPKLKQFIQVLLILQCDWCQFVCGIATLMAPKFGMSRIAVAKRRAAVFVYSHLENWNQLFRNLLRKTFS